jgi:transcriptional regulator with XRE-family HTH domain
MKEKTDEVLRLAARIKELRKEAGYTSYEIFAYEHEISRSQWGRYEKGEDIRFTSLIRICNIFGITLSEFFDGFDSKKKSKSKSGKK